jgi:uncharacterized protein (TIGR00297 family)
MLNTMLVAPPWWVAFLLMALCAGLAYWWRLLSWDGAIAATLCGTIIYGDGGARAIWPLLAFFLSASLLSKWAKPKARLHSVAVGVKGERRDAAQVLANGGIPTLIALYFHFYARHHLPAYRLEAVQLLFLSSIAAANADTWATEIGTFFGVKPRSLRNWQPVAPGISGAISWPGTLGGVLGAAFIPLVSWPLWHLNVAEFVLVTWAGFMGCGIDSLLGASLQAQYRDAITGRDTERPRSADGQPNMKVRGWRWMTNDVVNFLAACGAVLCAHYLIRAAAPLFPPY